MYNNNNNLDKILKKKVSPLLQGERYKVQIFYMAAFKEMVLLDCSVLEVYYSL
jgi:hypothetical protein